MRPSRAPGPVLAVTAGDPCGIGPEVILKALPTAPLPAPRAAGQAGASLLIIGDLAVFAQTASRLRRRLPRWEVRDAAGPWRAPATRLLFLDCRHRQHFVPGRSSARAGKASLTYLEVAVSLQHRRAIQGLVTAPVTKRSIQAVEPGFIGQTEFLADAMGVRDVVMMFIADSLRVALLTRHTPLRRVAAALDRRLVRTSLRLTAHALRASFGVARPRLVLCGLNPHAGEGSPASEEERVMRPVLRALRREGIICDGPVAADGFFAGRTSYDAVVCPYHDQGLIPFKLLARDRGCQLSVGLPIVRTSPDHGSALDIAGRGIAHAGSMRYALALAARLAPSHRRS